MTGHPDLGARFDRTAIRGLIDRLEELARETDPAAGEESAHRKSRKAYEALMLAGMLMKASAGWAIDHVCGLSLRDDLDAGKMLPFEIEGIDESEHYRAYSAAADQHDHEAAGAAMASHAADFSPVNKQRFLRNMLFYRAHGFPEWLHREALEAIDALRFGDTKALLRPTKSNRKIDNSASRAQLDAVCMVRFRFRIGAGLERSHLSEPESSEEKAVRERRERAALQKAKKEVGGHFGAGKNVLKSWERRLREELGELEVAREIRFAENAARDVLYAKSLNAPSDSLERADYEAAQSQAEKGLSRYGDDALRKAAQVYKDRYFRA